MEIKNCGICYSPLSKSIFVGSVKNKVFLSNKTEIDKMDFIETFKNMLKNEFPNGLEVSDLASGELLYKIVLHEGDGK
ncbi:MAG: hypothetical protein ACRC7W_01115 [Fusobacteriaceae bacterium]